MNQLNILVPSIKDEFKDQITLGYDKHVYLLELFIKETKTNNEVVKTKIGDRIFNGKMFNPPVRNNVNIKGIVSEYSKYFINLLSNENKDNFTHEYSDGVTLTNSFIKSKLRKGNFSLNFKFSINDGIIVDYDINFPNSKSRNAIFNTLSTQSYEFYDLMKDCCEQIYDNILVNDREFMWENFFLIKNYSYNIQDLKNMSKEERAKKVKECYKKEKISV